MVKTGYQYDDCDHSEVIQNVFEIVFALFYKNYVESAYSIHFHTFEYGSNGQLKDQEPW